MRLKKYNVSFYPWFINGHIPFCAMYNIKYNEKEKDQLLRLLKNLFRSHIVIYLIKFLTC
jgi:hypothetical protein